MHTLGRWFWRLGPGNPMVVRIVEGGSRRTQHMWVRMAYLGVLIGLVVFGLLSSGSGGGGSAGSLSELAKAGSFIFAVVAYGQVIAVCLLAPLFMAGAIASEQSGRTYNILLTTPLSNLQIVLGSLVGRLFFVLALLFSGLPLFAVVLVFGGVRGESVLLAFAVAGCTAVLVGSIAVTLSVFRAGGRKAVFVFVIATAACLVGAYALDVVLVRQIDGQPYTTWLTPLHPLLVLESSMQADYQPPPTEVTAGYAWPAAFFLGQPFAAFATWTLGVSTLLMLICAVFLRRVGTGEAVWLMKLRKALRLDGGERTHAAREVVGNPIAWREAHTRGKMFGGIVARYGFALLGGVAAAALLWAYHAGRLPNLPDATSPNGVVPPHQVFHQALAILLMLEVAVVTLVAIYMSAGCVSKEREDGTLDIMLTTPMTARQYIWGKLRGLVRFLSLMIAVPVLTLVAVSVYTLLGKSIGSSQASFTHYQTIQNPYGGGAVGGTSMPDVPLVLPEVGIWLALMLVPFVALCVASGMAWSLKSKSVLGAIVPTVGILGAVVLVLGMCAWSPLGSTPLIGPVLHGFSPATNTMMLINPWDRIEGFAESEAFGRVSLAVGAVAAAAVYSTIVYAMILGMVKGFDQTVRKLSGTG